MKIYSYVVRVDRKFAPNPEKNYCTLACCKPVIRRCAIVGDWVVGTGSVDNYGNDKLVYAMKVSEKMTFNEYYKDQRFKERIDNIYYKKEKSEYKQIEKPKHHGIKKQMEHDLHSEFVLISKEYVYFGEDAMELPTKMKWIIKKGPGHKSSCFTEGQKKDFKSWILNIIT